MSVGAFTVGNVQEVYNTRGNTRHILVLCHIRDLYKRVCSAKFFKSNFYPNMLYMDETLKFRRTE